MQLLEPDAINIPRAYPNHPLEKLGSSLLSLCLQLTWWPKFSHSIWKTNSRICFTPQIIWACVPCFPALSFNLERVGWKRSEFCSICGWSLGSSQHFDSGSDWALIYEVENTHIHCCHTDILYTFCSFFWKHLSRWRTFFHLPSAEHLSFTPWSKGNKAASISLLTIY